LGFLQREKLVAKIDEGHSWFAAPKLEGEQLRIEIERLLDIADFDGDMVEPDHAGLAGPGHGHHSSDEAGSDI
jgi:hypothetical protein